MTAVESNPHLTTDEIKPGLAVVFLIVISLGMMIPPDTPRDKT